MYLCVTRLRPRAKGGSGTRRAGRDNGSDSPTPEFGSDTPHPDWPFTWADMPRRMVVLVPLAPSAFVTVRSQHPQAWSTAVEDGGLTWVETGLGTNTSGSLDRRSSSSATPRGRTTTLLVRRAFFRSLANCEAAYLTLFRPYFAAPTDDAQTNKFLTQWGQAFNKECNYCFGGNGLYYGTSMSF